MTAWRCMDSQFSARSGCQPTDGGDSEELTAARQENGPVHKPCKMAACRFYTSLVPRTDSRAAIGPLICTSSTGATRVTRAVKRLRVVFLRRNLSPPPRPIKTVVLFGKLEIWKTPT